MRVSNSIKSTSYALIITCFISGHALAERVECAFSAPCTAAVCSNNEVSLSFEIDHRQFAPPIDRREPPRNKITTVAFGDAVFTAEPILMDDGTRGFWAIVDGVEHLMTVRPDGKGSYASTGRVAFMAGRCNIRNGL